MTQGISGKLSQLLGTTPPRRRAEPAEAPRPAAADGLRLSTAAGPLQKLLAGQEPAIAEWPALARQYARLGAGERLTLDHRLAQAGIQLSLVAGGRILLYRTADVAVAVEPGRSHIRRAEGTRVTLYDGGAPAGTMVALDGRITITSGRNVQVWHGRTGQGTENGKALTIPAAPAVPGESPRLAWDAPLRNNFRLPRYREGQDSAEYVALVDAAVERAGGKIVVPADALAPDADWTNCFSYALTQGEGDLSDPFARNGMPRWLQSPMYQLMMRGWGRVADTQRVHTGDLVLYRDADGAPSHAGVVRAVDAAGNPTWVESKFGAWGVYLHRPHDVHPAYGAPADYYRRP